MDANKIRKFMELAGQPHFKDGQPTKEARELGAQLLLSEVLEYVIKGLKVTASFNGTEITDANKLNYKASAENVDELEMIDGLADVAYTMYWNSEAFGVPLEEAFELVCDNNLEKFIELTSLSELQKLPDNNNKLAQENWHCKKNVSWPQEVVSVELVKVSGLYYAVGKDKNGKVRKPSSYKSVDLNPLLKDTRFSKVAANAA